MLTSEDKWAPAILAGLGYFSSSRSTQVAAGLEHVQRQLGKDAGQAIVELVDQARGLLGLALQRAGQFAELGELGRRLGRGSRLFDDREAGAGQGVHGVGLAFRKMDLAVIAILLGLADGDRLLPRQRAEELFQVGRVLTSGVNTNVK